MPMTPAQRLKRGILFKKLSSRIQAAKKRNARRIAPKEKLVIRARKKAIAMIRKKVAGKRGMNYVNLSPVEKQSIDKLVAKKKMAITRISKRLLPAVSKAERERFANLSKKEDVMPKTYKSLITEIYNRDLNESVFKVGNMKLDDGTNVKITKEIAELLNSLSKNVSKENQKNLMKKVMIDKKSFSEVLEFAREAL